MSEFKRYFAVTAVCLVTAVGNFAIQEYDEAQHDARVTECRVELKSDQKAETCIDGLSKDDGWEYGLLGTGFLVSAMFAGYKTLTKLNR